MQQPVDARQVQFGHCQLGTSLPTSGGPVNYYTCENAEMASEAREDPTKEKPTKTYSELSIPVLMICMYACDHLEARKRNFHTSTSHLETTVCKHGCPRPILCRSRSLPGQAYHAARTSWSPHYWKRQKALENSKSILARDPSGFEAWHFLIFNYWFQLRIISSLGVRPGQSHWNKTRTMLSESSV